MSRKVVLATGNQGKVAEMQSALAEFGFDVIPQSDYDFPEAIEDGLSFVENAIIKARHACAHTGLPAIADDSGLEVDALAGAPGIYSSRYACNEDGKPLGDAANNRKLLQSLKGHNDRKARFQCVIVYMQHEQDPTPVICHGTWEGEIATAAKGRLGFGYDPLFYVTSENCHAAQMSAEQKKMFSHRAMALAQLRVKLVQRQTHQDGLN